MLGTTVGTLYTISMMDGQRGSSLYDGSDSYLRHTADTEAKLFWLYFGGNEDADELKFSESNSFGAVIVVASISFILNWFGIMCWCAGIASIMIWGIMFSLLLREFFRLMNVNVERNTLDVMGTFSTFSY